jgi:hypothetical protein
VALLVSMHGWRLYERRNVDRLAPEDARAITAFLADQGAFQATLLDSLRAGGSSETHSDERIERNSLLIWTWDYLSLALCLGWAPATARRAPTAGEPTDLELTLDQASGRHHLHPWPFSSPTLTVRCEGRRLSQPADTDAALRDAFTQAPWETLEVTLHAR